MYVQLLADIALSGPPYEKKETQPRWPAELLAAEHVEDILKIYKSENFFA
jgi:hypothetical protein